MSAFLKRNPSIIPLSSIEFIDIYPFSTPNQIYSHIWFSLCSCFAACIVCNSTIHNPFFFPFPKNNSNNKQQKNLFFSFSFLYVLFFIVPLCCLCIASDKQQCIVAKETRVSVGIFITNVHSSHILTVHTYAHTRRSLLFHNIVIINLLHFGVCVRARVST